MAMMVWITVKVKDGNRDQVIELAEENHYNTYFYIFSKSL